MSQTKTVSISGETKIEFDAVYPYVWVRNLGNSALTVWGDVGDTVSLSRLEAVRVITNTDYIYVSGTGSVEVIAQGIPDSPYKGCGGGSGGGGGDITVEPILITHNGEYTAPEGKAYSPVNVQTPVYNITPLTLTHNHQGADAGLYGGYSPVEVQIEMDTLNAPTNGVYEIDTTQDGWDTVVVDTYEKYNILFYAGRNDIGGFSLVDSITASKYDEIYFIGSYQHSDTSAPTGNTCDLWNTRYTVDTVLKRGYIGNNGNNSFKWIRGSQHGTELQDFSPASGSYDASFMMIGVKTNDADRDTLWSNSEIVSPASITLSDSLFDYDEIILTFTTDSYDASSYTVTCSYPTSELVTGKTIYAYDSGDGHIMKWEITSGTVLTKISESNYYLVDVQGIKDTSMEETVLYTNSGTTNPTEITLSSSYENFDEIYLVGHIASDIDIISASIFPVKAISQPTDIPQNKMIGMFTDTLDCWYMVIDGTTLRNSNPSTGIILDKIIGINKPVISTAHELIDVVPLTANSNGTYTAPTGTAYSPVVVDVQEQPWEPLQDGYSNFWFELTDNTLTISPKFGGTLSQDAVIDWGDGTGEQALTTLSPTHTYSEKGKYTVKVKGVTGVALQFPIANYSGDYLTILRYAELNSEITTFIGISSYPGGFYYCAGLQQIAGLENISTSGTYYNCGFCSSLKSAKVAMATPAQSMFTNDYSLSNVELTSSVTSLGARMFQNCISLKSIIIPSSVAEIKEYAFQSSRIEEIHIQATTPPTLGLNVFASVTTPYIIYVPVGTGETYKAAAGWSAYADHILEEGETPNRAMMSRLAKADGDIMEAEKNEADDESSDKR